MPTLLSPADRDSIVTRLDRLRPDMKPRWGSMNASQMLAHLTDAVRMAFGEISATRARAAMILSRPFFKWLVIDVFPMPKGAPAAKEVLSRSADDWDAEKATLRAFMQRLDETTDDYPFGEHFVFGRLTRKQWGKLGYKHFDHHLRQFGL